MRKKFDYWGVPFSELFPNYHAPHTVECDCGERAKCIKSYDDTEEIQNELDRKRMPYQRFERKKRQ
ncbi:hypothetical protein CUS59_10925 [Enterococcus faecium]|uniref:hypothetical protein n=1 Tax=Enterococcus faecium TaxID=1352 RepID=UPI000CF27EDF|nr:hypothetical protein [Enterococcus faecium]PQF83585.1 hypothetical protein CUS59_10925 [Enterococcus faecium]